MPSLETNSKVQTYAEFKKTEIEYNEQIIARLVTDSCNSIGFRIYFKVVFNLSSRSSRL